MQNTTQQEGYYPCGCTFLREIRNDYYKAWKFEFECNWRSNRSGFVHEWDIYFDNSFYSQGHDKIQYYNRTRERFSYETLMENLLYNFLQNKDWKFIEENKDDIRKLCKDLNCYSLDFKILDRI